MTLENHVIKYQKLKKKFNRNVNFPQYKQYFLNNLDKYWFT